MNCPLCNVPLVMTERQSVEIDYCPDCRGIWLDRGELDKIIERSRPEQRSAESGRNYERNEHHRENDNHHGHDGYRHHKKKNFFGDLFD